MGKKVALCGLSLFGLIGLLLVGLYFLLQPPSLAVPQQGRHIFANVDVLNPGVSFDRGMTVIVDGGRIAEMRPTRIGDPVGLCPGCILMPGLIDVHIHTPPKIAVGNQELVSLLYLSHGVTAVRDVGASDETILALRDRLNSGAIVGPRMFACGPILEGDPPVWPMGIVLKTPEAARAQVAKLADRRVDCIKTYNALKAPVFAAINEAAAARSLPVIGHVPHDVDMRDIRDFEVQHYTGVPYAHGRPPPPDGSDWLDVDLNQVTDPELSEVIEISLANELSFTPTLINLERRLIASDSSKWPMTRGVEALPAFWPTFWQVGMGHPHGHDEIDNRLVGIETSARVTRLLYDAGIPILAGTDTLMPYVVPGEALIDEIKVLATVFESNEAALHAATVLNGRAVSDGETGELKVGARADLILLDGDPRENLENLSELEAVMVDGRLYPSAQLAEWRTLYQDHFHGAIYDGVLARVINWVAGDFTTTQGQSH